MSNEITFQLVTFKDWQPDSISEIVAEANELGTFVAPRINVRLSAERPQLAQRDENEWLDSEQIIAALSSGISAHYPSIVLTKHRLNLDYFGDTFPSDNVAVITTYNSYALPREMLEKRYVLYSLTYCALDLILKPNLWHADARGCIFDQILVPAEIVKGLDACTICDSCRNALSSYTQDFEISTIAFVERLLETIRVTVTSPRPKKVKTIKPAAAVPSNLGYTKGGFLVVDRAAMCRCLLNRFDIHADYAFADDPDQVRTILNEVTNRMGAYSDSTKAKVEELVRLNHSTDIFYLDVDKRHRDHSLHQLYVALFGLELLDIRIPQIHEHPKVKLDHTPFRRLLATQLKATNERAEWAWYVAAVLHDHAYPLSALLSRIARYLRVSKKMLMRDQMGERLTNDVAFYNELLAPPLARIVEEALTSAKDGRPNADEFEEAYVRLVRNALATFVDVREVERMMPKHRYDHGVIGAANLALWVGHDSPSSLEFICRAIFDHNLEREILLESQPLSFLLKLCDTLQEWDRIVYPSGGPPIRESEKVEIGPFKKTRGGLQLEEGLKVQFTFTLRNVLDQSGWQPERFGSTDRHARSSSARGR